MTEAVLSGDIGGTHIRLAVVDTAGNIIRLIKVKIERSTGRSNLTKQLISSAQELIQWASTKNIKILGVGIGIAGKIDPSEGKVIFSPNLPEANGKNISKIVSEYTKCPVFIDNDANVFGRGEAWRGEGSKVRSWLGITLGTGVGGCIILNNKLWQGDKNIGFVGEIGHMTIYPDGFRCACGKRGCLEAYASEGGLLRRIAHDNLYSSSGRIKSAKLLYLKALEGDPVAVKLFEDFGRALGIAIANGFTLLGVRHAIIGGGVSQAWEVFKQSMFDAAYSNCSMLSSDQIFIVKSKLGDEAAILGAAKLVLDSI